MPGKEYLSSVFYAYDDSLGWGNTTYFTFLSQFRYDWPGQPYLEAIILVILTILSYIGNLFIMWYIYKHKTSRTITNYFVCNLALADILFVSAGPFIAAVRITQNWIFSSIPCSLVHFSEFVCGTVIIWTMAAISLDRYFCINLNVNASRRLKPRHVLFICLAIWTVACAGSSPIAMYTHLKDAMLENDTVTFCTIMWPVGDVSFSSLFVSLLIIIAFVVPLVIIVVNYVRIFKKFWHTKRTVSHCRTENVAQLSSRSTDMRRRRSLRTVKMLVLLVVLFLAMWCPLFIVFLLIQVDNVNGYMAISSSALVWTIMVTFGNACINPFLYGAMNIRLLKTLKAMCGCCVCCNCCFSNTSITLDKQTTANVHTLSYQS